MSITLSEALRLGRENSKCCDEHRHNLEIMGKKVERYAAQNWQIQTFQELKIHHVLQLIRDMEKQGRKPSYIKHTMNTIRLASNYAKDYLELDVVKIEKRHLPQTLEAPKIWLTYRQLATACYVAMDTEVRRKPGSRMSRPRPLELARLIILTCGLCGLRLTEFGRLVPECLDSENNLTIMKAKTDPSNRIIPLPSIVADALRAFWNKNG